MPITSIIMLAVMGGVVVFVMLFNKKRMRAIEAQTTNSRAGELAQRMGLKLVQGDPLTNLAMARMLSTNYKGEMPEVHVRLEGSPGGRDTQLEYYERTKVAAGFGGSTISTWLTAHVAVAVRRPFPAFEVVLKNAKYFASELQPKLAAPPTPFGDSALDATLLLKTRDPRVASVIAEPLRALTAWSWVHIHGEDGKLTFHCSKATVGVLGVADQLQLVLGEMATNLEQAAAAHGAA